MQPILIHDFLTQSEHDSLLLFINNSPWDDTSLNRRVQHYGYKYQYKKNYTTNFVLEQVDNIPTPFIDIVFPKLFNYGILSDTDPLPNQCIINEYKPGQGIAPHTDHKIFDNKIISITLGSQCVMNFTSNNYQPVDCLLSPKSAIVLSDNFRWDYKHGIKNVKSDKHPVSGVKLLRGTRVSITLRHC